MNTDYSGLSGQAIDVDNDTESKSTDSARQIGK